MASDRRVLKPREMIAADVVLGDIGATPAFTAHVETDGNVDYLAVLANPRWSTGELVLIRVAAALMYPAFAASVKFADVLNLLDDHALQRVLGAITVWRGWSQ